MKIFKYFALITLLTFAFSTAALASGNDPERADEWFMRERMKSPAPRNKKSLEDYIKEGQERLEAREKAEEAAKKQAKEDKKAAEKERKEDEKARKKAAKVIPRYIMLFADDNFIYWLDTEALRWRPMPYSALEDMLDCWVKMEDISADKEYTYPEKYYMEHLYLRPAKNQVMFLSELEVTGRPENNIKERPYKPSYWEELVPSSVEEEIYKGTLKVLKTLEKKKRVKPSDKEDKYDFLEDTLHIYL